MLRELRSTLDGATMLLVARAMRPCATCLASSAALPRVMACAVCCVMLGRCCARWWRCYGQRRRPRRRPRPSRRRKGHDHRRDPPRAGVRHDEAAAAACAHPAAVCY